MIRFRILHKILLGFTFYLGIAVFFGVYVYVQIGQIMTKHQLVEIADDTKELLTELLRNEKDYLTSHQALDLERIHATIATLEAKFQEAAPAIASAFSPDDFQTLTSTLPRYAALMTRYQRNQEQSELLISELQKISVGLEEESHHLADRPFQNEVLHLRLLESNYLRLHNQEAFAKLRAQIEATANRLNRHSRLHPQTSRYLAGLDQLLASTQEDEQLLHQARSASLTMEMLANQAEARERDDISSYSTNSRQLMIVALGALIFFGSLLSWLFAKIIALPLQRLEATTRQIAAGRHDLRMEERGDAETFSLQHSFNVMLDSLHAAHESLAQSLAHLQVKGKMLIQSEKMASIGILASGVAHEINNPLANISLTTEILQGMRGQLEAAKVDELLAAIITQTERAAAVVKNLLEYARARREDCNQEEDLIQIVQQSLQLVAPELKRQAIELHQLLPRAPLTIVGNRGKLEQVFVNVILNAIQATGAKGTLTIRAALDPEGEFAVLDFIDNGPGIAPENLDFVFDPFFTTKPTATHNGLGLYVSYGIIQEQGGTVQVEDAQGQGTKVTICLPTRHRQEPG